MNVDDLELELRKLPGVRSAGFTERDDVLLIQLQVSGDTPPPNLPLQATRIAYRHSENPVALEVVRWRVSALPRHTVAAGGTSHEAALGSLAGIDALPEEAVEANGAGDHGPAPVTVEGAPEAAVAVAPAVPEPRPAPREQRVRLLAVLTFPDTDELEVHLTFEGRRIIGRAVASNGILGVVEAMVDGLRVFVPRLEFTPSWARVLNDDGKDAHVVACELIAPDDSRRLGIAAGASAIEAAARATLHALNRSIAKHLIDDRERAGA
jgi:hypothetical protein